MKLKHRILRIILKKEIELLIETRQTYWEEMEKGDKHQEYYQTRRCELDRILDYLFGFEL